MSQRANPTSSKGVDSPSKVDRKVMCASYERCLDKAIKNRWRGFSCHRCRAFKPMKLDPTDWFLDSLACIALLYTAEFQNSFKQKSRGTIVVRLQDIRSKGGILGWI